MEDLGERPAVLPGVPRRVQQLRHLAVGLHELLEVQGVHLHLVHVSHGDRAHVPELDAEQRTAQHIVEPPVLDQILHVGNSLGTFLDFVEEYERPAGNHRLPGEGGQPCEDVALVLHILENASRSGRLHEVELHDRIVVPAPELLDDERLADLPRPVDEQRAVLALAEEGLQFSLNLPANH